MPKKYDLPIFLSFIELIKIQHETEDNLAVQINIVEKSKIKWAGVSSITLVLYAQTKNIHIK